MNFTKNIFIGILFLYITTMSSQTTTSYLETNIQQHIVNKYWSNEAGTTGKVVLYFGQNQLSTYINQKKFGSGNYYFTNISCNDSSSIFDNSKIGNSSSGNYIKTDRYCYLIEISTNLQQIRMKKSYDNKWQTFYLLNNPNLPN
ncbi:hypothetical protein [Flavobacterium cellulosilyticum]|uniref:DUF4488 domain-containing protein n=1 Tax=Flavobacterium cellulosilyticum TaxID=2541731 RepID=A0A4R5CER9_9FLAO|nr:hypothetical protein [Flavobacterium cellulosilyticum]TDD98561.1 hypothetical protein E0F76_05380 [Flavobacterium cellulosilyticum]